MLKYLGIVLLLFGILYPVICYKKIGEQKISELEKYMQIVNNCSRSSRLFADSLPEILRKTYKNSDADTSKEGLLEDIRTANLPPRATELLMEYFTLFGSDSYGTECEKANACKDALGAILESERTEGKKRISALGALLSALGASGAILLL